MAASKGSGVGAMSVLDSDWYVGLDPLSGEIYPGEGHRLFYKMMLNDPVVGGVMWHLRAIFNQAYVESSLREGVLDWGELFLALVYGFYCGEIVVNGDGLAEVSSVHPVNVYEIGRKQVKMVSGGELVRGKCLLVSLGGEGGNPYGVSVLRHVYKPWYYKTRLEEYEDKYLKRMLVGLPFVVGPEGFNFMAAETDERVRATLEMMQEIVNGIADGKQKGAVLPNGWDLSFKGNDVREEVLRRKKELRTEILVGLFDGLYMDEGKNDYSIIDIMRFFVEEVGRQVGREIGRFGHWLRAGLPKWYDIGDLASYIGRLVKNEVIEVTDELEEKVVRAVGFSPSKLV